MEYGRWPARSGAPPAAPAARNDARVTETAPGGPRPARAARPRPVLSVYGEEEKHDEPVRPERSTA